MDGRNENIFKMSGFFHKLISNGFRINLTAMAYTKTIIKISLGAMR